MDGNYSSSPKEESATGRLASDLDPVALRMGDRAAATGLPDTG